MYRFCSLFAAVALAAIGATGCSGSKKTTSAATLPAPFNVAGASGAPAGSAISSLAVFGDHAAIALMNNFGTPGPDAEKAIPFDPQTGAIGVSVTARQPLAFAPPLPNRAGQLVSATVTSTPAFAATSDGKLYITCSDVNDQFVLNPGAVLVYDYDASSGRIGAFRTAIATVSPTGEVLYNPAAIVAFTRPGDHERLAVVCGDDPFAAGPVTSSVVVIDPRTDTLVEVARIGGTQASAGPAALAPDLRLYVGSAVNAEIYVVDLATSPPTVERGAANPVSLTTTSGTNLVSDVDISTDGTRLYALDSNDGALTVLSRATPTAPSAITRVADFKRGAGGPFVDDAQTLAVRPGRGGVDFSGPDVAVGVINVTPSAVPTVETAVDTVVTYATPADVTLNALVTPFQPGLSGEIQQIVAPRAGSLAGALYIVDIDGNVIARRWSDFK